MNSCGWYSFPEPIQFVLYFTQKLTYRVGLGVNRWRNVPQLGLVAPARKRASSEPPPVWYSVAEIVAGLPSCPPTAPTLALSEPSCNSVPTGGGGAGAGSDTGMTAVPVTR